MRPLARFADTTAGSASALVFGALSALRRKRIFHPDGDAFEATLDVAAAREATGVHLLDDPGRRRCLVRFSRGFGFPEPMLDILGVAIRILDVYGPGACQDFLLVTSGEAPVLRSTLGPATGYADRHYSSLLPYRFGDRTVLVGARPLLSSGSSPRRFDELQRAASDGRLRLSLEVAEVFGPWEPVGVVELGRRLPPAESEALAFNVFNTGGGIEPIGVLNGLRRKAYAGSQAARPTT